MKPIYLLVSAISMLIALAGFAQDEEYEKLARDWRVHRLVSLRGESGYLNLVGLFPLSSATHRFGFSAHDDLRLAPIAEFADSPSLGVFERQPEGGYRFVASGAAPVTNGEASVDAIVMVDDASGEPTVLASGRLRWYVVSRGGELLVRVRNLAAPAIGAFGGFDYFPLNAEYRVEARFEPAESVREIRLDNVIGTYEAYPFVGHLSFELGGAAQRLTAVESGGRLFVIFGDATNGGSTYGGGRFLYADYPKDGGTTALDFNFAYNPPCSFSAYTTCPLPPPGNRMDVAIEAGEKAP